MAVNARWAFERYESVRHRLPSADFAGTPERIDDLSPIAARFDAFVFDSFGVLNTGNQPVQGAIERIRALRDADKMLLVLTNAASKPLGENRARYQQLGFDFADDEIVSSRAVLAAAMSTADPGWLWAVAAPDWSRIDQLPGRTTPMTEESLKDCDAMAVLSTLEWTDDLHAALIGTLKARPRPLWIGNPDIVAPWDHGFTLEPGYFAHDIADATGIEPRFFGKPFGNAFDMIATRLAEVPPARILMIGDTLHTDILGGRVAGLATALVTGAGVLKGMDVTACIQASGIVPDYVMPRI